MYTDKINPDHPEGRLLISEKGFLLKDPSLPTSMTPLPDKAQAMFNHLEDKGFETESKARMRRSYDAICQAKAWRNIGRYNQVLSMLPKERKFLSWWLLFDYYDMLPDGCRVNTSSAYYKLTPYYRDIVDNCMREAQGAGIRDLTTSVEASMTSSFFLHLQTAGVHRLEDLQERNVRDYTRSGKVAPMIAYRISVFLRRYAYRTGDAAIWPILHYFPKELRVRKIYEAFTHEDRERLEAFILSAGCPLSKRDRAIVALLLYTGMRGRDVRDLRLVDIDWAKSTIRFRQGKTLGEVILPLRPIVGNLIHAYIASERPRCDNGQCFVSAQPHSGKYGLPGISSIVNRAYSLCGIRQDGVRKGPHLLRHSLADEMVNAGNDVTMVSKTLGHLSPNTSLGYMSSNIEQLRACALSIEPYPVTHKLYCHE